MISQFRDGIFFTKKFVPETFYPETFSLRSLSILLCLSADLQMYDFVTIYRPFTTS